jgi:hypothetical protein
MMDLAIDSTGTLYATVGDRLWTLDTSSGASTVVTNFDGGPGFDFPHGGDFPLTCDGACCDNGPGTESDCVIATKDECEAGRGLFLGNGTECADDLDCVVLLVTFDSLSAVATADGVRVAWTTVTEIDTVGFRVLRETAAHRRLPTATWITDVVWSANRIGSRTVGTAKNAAESFTALNWSIPVADNLRGIDELIVEALMV